MSDIDALENELAKTTDPKNRVDLLNQLAFRFGNFEPEKARRHITEAYQILTEKLPDYETGYTDYRLNKACDYHRQANYSKALELALEVETDYSKTDNKRGLSNVLFLLCGIYHQIGNYTLQLEAALKRYEIARQLGDKKVLAQVDTELGIVYDMIDDYQRSIERFSRALAYYQHVDDSYRCGLLMYNMASTFRNLEEYDMALEHAIRSCELIAQQNAHYNDLAIALGVQGHVYEDLAEYDLAIESHVQKLKIVDRLDSHYMRAYTFADIGRVLSKQGKVDEGIARLHSAIEVAEKHGVQQALMDAYEAIVVAFEAQGEYQNALDFHKKWATIRAEMRRKQSELERNALSVIHETKEAQLQAKIEKERAEQFRALAENSPDLILRFSLDGKVRYANASVAIATQLPLLAIETKNIDEINRIIQASEPLSEIHQSVLHTQRLQQTDIQCHVHDKPCDYHVLAVPEYSVDGNIESVLFINRDITELKVAGRRIREITRFVQMLLELTTRFHQDLPFEQILYQMLEQLNKIYTCDYMSIVLIKNGQVERVASRTRNMTDADVYTLVDSADFFAYSQMLESGKLVMLNNTNIEVHGLSPETFTFYLGFPLILSGRVIGFLNFFEIENRAIDAELQLQLQTVAAHMAMAISVYESFKEAQEVTILNERQRIAREFHDVISQQLISATMITESLPRLIDDRDLLEDGLNELLNLTRTAIDEMRMLLLELRPNTFLQMPLSKLIEDLLRSYETKLSNMQFSVDSVCEDIELAANVKFNIYRIVQESLNNISKHAEANQVSLSLHCVDDGLRLVIEDDGKGFQVGHTPSDRLGLHIMRERAEQSGLELTITSQLDKGTRIELSLAN